MSITENSKRRPVNLQVPPEIYTALRSLAQQNEHTLNKQVNILLRDFFRDLEARTQKSA